MRLKILAAGSLKAVWQPLMAQFSATTGIAVSTAFGPAGLLRARIEGGEPCDFFASANMAHPASLVAQGRAEATACFALNALCLTVDARKVDDDDDWFSLLMRPDLRLGTSTPLSDPSGDYTWQLFDNLAPYGQGISQILKGRARQLVGGPQSLQVPAGETAAGWLIGSDLADMFIGYASYGPRLRKLPRLRVLDIPAPVNPRAEYGYALLRSTARPLAAFLHSAAARAILADGGFLLP